MNTRQTCLWCTQWNQISKTQIVDTHFASSCDIYILIPQLPAACLKLHFPPDGICTQTVCSCSAGQNVNQHQHFIITMSMCICEYFWSCVGWLVFLLCILCGLSLLTVLLPSSGRLKNDLKLHPPPIITKTHLLLFMLINFFSAVVFTSKASV